MLVEHKDVAEAAVVPIPHAVKGEALYCFVTMNDGTTFSASTQAELIAMIRTKIAPFAMPDYIQVDNLNIAYSVCSLDVPRLEEAILTPVLKKNFKRPLILGQEGHRYPPKHSNLSYDQFGVRLEQSDTAPPPFSLLAGEILNLSAGFVLFSTVVFLADLEIYFFVPVSGH